MAPHSSGTVPNEITDQSVGVCHNMLSDHNRRAWPPDTMNLDAGFEREYTQIAIACDWAFGLLLTGLISKARRPLRSPALASSTTRRDRAAAQTPQPISYEMARRTTFVLARADAVIE